MTDQSQEAGVIYRRPVNTDMAHGGTCGRFMRAVSSRFPHAGVRKSSSMDDDAVYVDTNTSYYQEIVELASDTGMKFSEKVAGNDATGEATYEFVPKR